MSNQEITLSSLTKNHSAYLKSLSTIKNVENLISSGKVIPIDKYFEVYPDEFRLFIEENLKISLEDDKYLFEIIKGNISNENPVLKLKNSKKIIESIKCYYSVNNKQFMEDLGAEYMDTDEPSAKEDFLRYVTPRHLLISTNIENELKVRYKNLHIVISLSRPDQEIDAVQIWNLETFMFHNNKLVANFCSDLTITNYLLSEENFFFDMDSDSGFLADTAHYLLSNYLKREDTWRNTVNDLFSGDDIWDNFGMVHTYSMNIDEKYKDKGFEYLILESIQGCLSHSEYHNFKYIVDSELDYSSFSKINDVDFSYSVNGSMDDYEYDIGLCSGVSIFTFVSTVNCYLESKEDEESKSGYTEKEMQAAIHDKWEFEKRLRGFKQQYMYNAESGADIVIVDTEPTGHHEGLVRLGTYIHFPEVATEKNPYLVE